MRRKKILIWVSVVSVIMNTISVSAVSQNTNNMPTEDIIQNDTQSLEQSISEDPDLSMPQEKNYQDNFDNLTDEAVPYSDANDTEMQEPATQDNVSPMSMTRTIPGRWIESGGRWWYQHNDGGYTTNGWEEINGIWYHFDSAGWMEVDKWISDGGRWYYVSSSGAMVVENWMLLGGKWYYFDGHGQMVTGWLTLGVKKYYLDSSGVMVTGNKTINGTAYYFVATGELGQRIRKVNEAQHYFTNLNGNRVVVNVKAQVEEDVAPETSTTSSYPARCGILSYTKGGNYDFDFTYSFPQHYNGASVVKSFNWSAYPIWNSEGTIVKFTKQNQTKVIYSNSNSNKSKFMYTINAVGSVGGVRAGGVELDLRR